MALPSAGRILRGVLLAAGVAAVALAAALWFAPGIVPLPVRVLLATVASVVPADLAIWGLAGGAALYALVRAVSGRSAPAAAPEFLDRDPEVPARETPPVGAGFDRTVSATAPREDLDAADDPVRERLRATAIAALARRTDLPETAAREAVATGGWTDDRVAAAFIGGSDAPSAPVGERVRGWIRPGATFQRRVDRTVEAIAAVDGRGQGQESSGEQRRREGST